MKLITIDAGHGKAPSWSPLPIYNDPGAVYRENGKIVATERGLVVPIARHCTELLKTKTELQDCLVQWIGVVTEATNMGKINFANKVLRENGIQPYQAIGVSLHTNSSINKSGCMGYYQSSRPETKEFVMYILRAINKYFNNIPVLGALSSKESRWGDRLYINSAKYPYVLIEMGYTRGNVEELQQSERMGEAVAHGIMTWIRLK